MKVFKTIIAGVLVGALTLAMATSAFAATANVTKEGAVTTSGFTAATSGNMTVMVVNKAAYDANTITADDICYIDQFSASEAATKLASLASRNLKFGDYKVVVGSNSVAAQTAEVGTISVGEVAADGKALTWVVTVKPQYMVSEQITAKLYNTATEATSEAAALYWDDGVVGTGEGDVEFEVVTNLKDAQYADSTELEIATGAISNRN